MFERVVKFKDGTYGHRRWCWRLWRYEYKDLTIDNSRYWFPQTSEFFIDCKGTINEVFAMSKKSAEKTFDYGRDTDIGTSLNKKHIERIRIINALKGA